MMRHRVLAALLCGAFVAAPAFAGGVLSGGVGGTLGGRGTIGVGVPSLPSTPAPSGRVGADVDVGADVNGRTRIETLTEPARTRAEASVEEEVAPVLSEADVRLNLEATASGPSDVKAGLEAAGKSESWFDIF
jgi:hypothetical protein